MSPKVVEATLCSGKNCGDGYQLIRPTIAPFRVLLSVTKPIKNNMGDICKIQSGRLFITHSLNNFSVGNLKNSNMQNP